MIAANTGASLTPEGLEALREAIRHAKDLSASKESSDSLIYLGSARTTVPKSLLYDPMLSPADKICWQVIRDRISGDTRQPSPFPTRSELSQLLARSLPSITQSIRLLRATRWTIVCGRQERQAGKFGSVIHLLSEEPLSIADTLTIDPEYLDFLGSHAEDSYPRLAAVCLSLLNAIDHAIDQGREHELIEHESTLERLEARLSGESNREVDHQANKSYTVMFPNPTQNQPSQPPGQKIVHGEPAQEAETSRHSKKIAPVHQDNKSYMEDALRSCSSYINTTTTAHAGAIERAREGQIETVGLTNTSRERESAMASSASDSRESDQRASKCTPSETVGQTSRTDSLRFPPQLGSAEIHLAQRVINNLDPEDRQYILDYMRDRLSDTAAPPIRNAIGYLRTIVHKHRSGELGPSSYGLRFQAGNDSASQPSASSVSQETPEEAERIWRKQMSRFGHCPDELSTQGSDT